MRTKKSTFFVIFTFVLFAFLLFISILLFKGANDYNTREHVSVSGTVTYYDVSEHYDSDDGYTTYTYEYFASYEYEGANYESGFALSEKYEEKYAVGNTVEFEVYKDDPSQVASKPDVTLNIIILVCCIISFLAFLYCLFRKIFRR